VEIGVLKANATAIVLKLADTPYQDLMVFMAPLVNLSPTYMFSIMLIGDLSSTLDDDDYSMHSNLLSIL